MTTTPIDLRVTRRQLAVLDRLAEDRYGVCLRPGELDREQALSIVSAHLAGRRQVTAFLIVLLVAWPVALYGLAFYLFSWWGIAAAVAFSVLFGQLLRRVAVRLARSMAPAPRRVAGLSPAGAVAARFAAAAVDREVARRTAGALTVRIKPSLRERLTGRIPGPAALDVTGSCSPSLHAEPPRNPFRGGSAFRAGSRVHGLCGPQQ